MKTIRNEADKTAIINRLNKLTGEEKALWGKMTVNQMLSHLVQSGEMPFGHALTSRSNFMSRNLIKPLVLYVLPMPKEVKTSPEMDQQIDGRKPEEFERDRAATIDLTQKLGTMALDNRCAEHPFSAKCPRKNGQSSRTNTLTII